MGEDIFISLAREALYLSLLLSAPPVLAVLAVVFAATALVRADGTVLYDAGQNFALQVAAGAIWAGGMSRFLAVVGIPAALGGAIGSIFLAVMALTVMQLVLRFMRVASAELLGDRITVFKNPHVGSLIAIAGCQQGMACGGSAMAVGQCTTSAVVMSIVLIVVSASILTVIYINLGI